MGKAYQYLFIILLVSCGTKTPQNFSKQEKQELQSLTYSFYEPSCSTGEKTYLTKQDYCFGLRDNSINQNCAKYQREVQFEQYCLQEGFSWPKAYSCQVELYDHLAREPDPKFLLATQSFCVQRPHTYKVSYARNLYTEVGGRQIGLNVMMDLTGQRKDTGDGTAIITTYNLNNPEDHDLPKTESFHTHGAVWDQLDQYWIFVACSKIETCPPVN